MKLKEFKHNTLRFLGHLFLTRTVDLLCKSVRINFINKEVIDRLESENKNYVVAFWHETMILPWYLHGRKNTAALTSKSKDGDLLAKHLKHWGYEVVRGSSSKGGDIALGIMIDHAKNNYSIAVTPDGPRGPIHQFKAGAVVTAKKSSLPLVLLGIGFKRKKLLKSWDKFQVPYFFTQSNVFYSELIFISKDASYEETSAMIKYCENKLIELQSQAGRFS
jgi:lysophospholipid acyltransferase (LPLAT)-like uncharacterized protein